MAKLKVIEDLVLKVLENYPETRKDDYLLMAKVCETVRPDIMTESFGKVLYNYQRSGAPNWKSVERARRKVQSKHPYLKDDNTANARVIEEMRYREYAISWQ